MTRLAKSIAREVAVGGMRKPLIVTIDPESQRIGIHEKNCRTIYWLPIMTVFALAIRANEKGK
jgi:hypothetical protein